MAKKAAKKKVARRPRAARMLRAVTPASQFQALLTDPCNGPVGSHFGGEAGIVQRFVQDFTINTTTGHTCGYVLFTPAANVYLSYSNTADNVFGSPASNPGPGNAFVLASARKIRACAACITVLPSAVSMTNMTGEIAVANVSSNTIEAGTGYNVAGVFQLAASRAVLAKRQYEVKWYPQMLDATYAPVLPTGAASLPDPADHNSILMAYRGYPAGAALVRITTVVEWTPAANIGLAVTTTPTPPVPHQSLSALLHQHNPSWWHNLAGDVAEHMAREGGRAVKQLASYGLARAVRYGAAAMPALLAA